MDVWDILLALGIIFCLGILVYGANQFVFAFDYIDAGRGAWDNPPKICINPPAEQKWYSMRAISEWRKVWESYTGNNGLNFKMATIHPYPQMDCNIEIVDGNPRAIGSKPNALGAASCNEYPNGTLKKCIIVMHFSHEEYYTTLQHEVGHTLGLGHRLPYNVTGFAGVVMSNDIMNPMIGSFQKITEEDIKALTEIYGIDGFKNPETVFIPRNYTIPH